MKSPYHELINKVGWFFFDLLVLGYVEDPSSGKSFHFPANLSWKLFIEVSCSIGFFMLICSKLALNVIVKDFALYRFHQELLQVTPMKILSCSKLKSQF